MDPRDPRETASFDHAEHHSYVGHIGLTVMTGGLWLLARRLWQRRKSEPGIGTGTLDGPIVRR